MDVDVTLGRIREIIAGYDKESDEEMLANELVDLVDGLDGWMTRGGYLPKEWETGRDPHPSKR